jgi:hypothetical protein|nr:putative acetyltransferase [uncultured Mediterranean phage uvMED]BAR29383.1 putative acetyltransferase [uncultured Mediterranean phage uvMED]
MKKIIFSSQQSLFGNKEIVGFGTDKFYVKEINKNLANDIIKKNHYSGKVYSNTYIHLGIFIDQELMIDADDCYADYGLFGEKTAAQLVGVLQYGYAMNPASMSSVVANTKINEYLELNRMWIKDKTLKYIESQSISMSLSYIKSKYKKVKWIQSFADERCGGFGIVYQACSFDYYGEHTSDFWELEGVVYHNVQMTRAKSGQARYLQENKENAKRMKLRQFRYIKFLKSKFKKDCLLKNQPYPKHYDDSKKLRNAKVV